MNTAGRAGSTADGWTIVVPVKALGRAKSRLMPALGADGRRALVVGMALDVLGACRQTPGVTAVRVVSADPRVEELASAASAGFVDEPADPDHRHGDPLNLALDRALADIAGPVGVVAADLPELRPEHLARILEIAGKHPHTTVTDHRGAGTTMAFWTDTRGPRVCRFGAGSAARFRIEGGAVPITVEGDLAAAARDVDVPEDLARLSGRTVGPATARALRDPSLHHFAHEPGASATMVP